MSLSFARMVDLESEIDTAKAHGVLGCGGREQMIGIIDSCELADIRECAFIHALVDMHAIACN